MTIRTAMFNACRDSTALLEGSASLVGDFLLTQITPGAGFADRSGKSDLYYTFFGLEALLALDISFDRDKLSRYLESFAAGDSLDLVHLACLIRCLADLNDGKISEDFKNSAVNRLHGFRCADGGFSHSGDTCSSSLYGCFFAVAACQDLNVALPRADSLLSCIASLKASAGGYSNDVTQPPAAPATAAALTVLNALNQPPDRAAIDFLMDKCFHDGGFCAIPDCPVPDLLSTAAVLHALAVNNVDISPIAPAVFDFTQSLWTGSGSFCPSWVDDTADSEYTYYGLLTMGHLAGCLK